MSLFNGNALIAPVSVSWNITDACNLSCSYCLNNSNNNSFNGLSLEECKNIINLLKQGGVTHITFMGGEPFYYPYIFEVIEYAAKKKMFMRFVTNGILLSEQFLDDLKQHHRFIQYIQLSLHDLFYLEDYKKIIKSLFNSGININTICIIDEETKNTSVCYFKCLAEYGIDSFFIAPIAMIGRAKKQHSVNNTININSLIKTIKHLERIKIENNLKTRIQIKTRKRTSDRLIRKYSIDAINHMCIAGYSSFKILSDGTCIPCEFIKKDIDRYSSNVKIQNTSELGDIWNCAGFNNFRNLVNFDKNNLLDIKCQKCKFFKREECIPCLISKSRCSIELKQLYPINRV